MTFEPYTVDFEVANSNVSRLTLPWQFRERHLTEECEGGSVQVQSCGDEIRISVFSERDDLMIRIPLAQWYCDKPRKRSLGSWRINIDRHFDLIDWDTLDEDRGEVGVMIAPIQIKPAKPDNEIIGKTET